MNDFEGTIVKGIGEGAFFMSMRHYQKEIKRKLGFNAYPGTLNLKVGKKQKNLLKNFNQIIIEGFTDKGKTFGGADCYAAKIGNVNGAVVISHLTKHKNVIELIAPVHLKSELKMKNGDKIKVEII